jgi:hypothetical protein
LSKYPYALSGIIVVEDVGTLTRTRGLAAMSADTQNTARPTAS